MGGEEIVGGQKVVSSLGKHGEVMYACDLNSSGRLRQEDTKGYVRI